MPPSFLILWSSDRIRDARKSQGRCVPFLFGGPHTSEPSLSRYHIQPGDMIYPISVAKGRMAVLCEVTIDRLMSLEDFLAENHVPQHRGTASDELHAWLTPQRWQFLAPTCTDEAAIARASTPLRFDRFVPDDDLAALRLKNRKGEYALKKVEEGRLKSSMSLQGHYFRLSEPTAALFASLVDREGPIQ